MGRVVWMRGRRAAVGACVAAAVALAACSDPAGGTGVPGVAGAGAAGAWSAGPGAGAEARRGSPLPSSTPSAGSSSTPSPEGPGIPLLPEVGPTRPWTISPIRGELRRALVPRNWRPGCPVPLDDLRWLTVAYRGFDGRRRVGPIVVHEAVAEDVRWVFRRLFRAGFPIKRVALPRRFRDLPRSETWDDTRNVTSGFNCRPVTDGTSWSQHAYGLAIDINPLQNPYVRPDGSVLRRAARPYRDRSLDRPGMIHEGDAVVEAFDAIGWEWGGRWRTLKDYMHFSATGS